MKLWLIRHAKSSWANPGQSDFDRPLNARGERDGPRMVEWLRRQAQPAQWIWTSSAARARATTKFVQAAFELPDEAVATSRALYHASPDALLDVIQQTPDHIQSLAVVAHNPGMTWLVNSLCDAEVTANLPTFGVARLDCPEPWHELRIGRATLDLLEAPKTID